MSVEQREVAVQGSCRAVLLSQQPGHSALYAGEYIVSGLALPRSASRGVQAEAPSQPPAGLPHELPAHEVGGPGSQERKDGEHAGLGSDGSDREGHINTQEGEEGGSVAMVDPVHGYCVPSPAEIVLKFRPASSNVQQRCSVTGCAANWWHTLITFEPIPSSGVV